MRNAIVIAVSVLLFVFAGLYLPAFIAFNALPDEWARLPTSHWWTIPTLVTLIFWPIPVLALSLFMLTSCVD